MKMNIRKTMRALWIALMLVTISGGMMSCDMETVPCERCEQHYDREGGFIGETCWQVACCEITWPYDCSNQF